MTWSMTMLIRSSLYVHVITSLLSNGRGTSSTGEEDSVMTVILVACHVNNTIITITFIGDIMYIAFLNLCDL